MIAYRRFKVYSISGFSTIKFYKKRVFSMKKQYFFLLSALLLNSFTLLGKVTVPAIFSDHAVLAKKAVVPIFGKAAPGEKVSVSFNGQVKSTTAGKNGRWMVKLDLEKSPAGPFELHINDLVIKDVLVGSVWLCSGQSNMAFQLSQAAGFAAEKALPENTMIRTFNVKNAFSTVLQDEISGEWITAGEKIGSFSAVAYFFAKKIHQTLNIPVGLVNSSWGGSPLEAWMSEECIENFPVTKETGRQRALRTKEFPARMDKFLADNQAWMKKYGRVDIFNNNFPPDNAEWQNFTGPDFPGNGVYWLKNRITLSVEDAKKGFRVYFGRVYSPLYCYIGRKLIKQVDDRSAWSHEPVIFNVDGGVFQPGEYELLIRFSVSHNETYFAQPLHFGNFTIDGNNWQVFQEKYFGTPKGRELAERPIPIPRASAAKFLWSRLFNAMINPLIPYGFTGVLWYQGEANIRRYDEYAKIFPAMIEDWRQKFECSDLPFYFCQLAPFTDKTTHPDNNLDWPRIRNAQLAALKLPNTGAAILLDVGEAKDIHPTDKTTPGYRLAALALKNIYRVDIPCFSPEFRSASKKGNIVTVKFNHTYGGLVSTDIPENYILKTSNKTFKKLIRNSPDAQLESFALCGPDGQWYWADKAEISGHDSVTVSSDKVAHPVKIRYCYVANPTCNLFNKAGFPAVQFEKNID